MRVLLAHTVPHAPDPMATAGVTAPYALMDNSRIQSATSSPGAWIVRAVLRVRSVLDAEVIVPESA